MQKEKLPVKLQQFSKVTAALALLAFAVMSATPAHASSLLGTLVTGQLFEDGGSINFFDPFNGEVPPTGFGNSHFPPGVNSNIVPISDGAPPNPYIVEFGYVGENAVIQGNFTGAGIFTVMTTFPTTSPNTFVMTFSNPAFAGMQLSGPAGVPNCAFAAASPSIISAEFLFGCTIPVGATNFVTTYALVPRIPEPTSLTLLALGLAGIIASRLKRE